LCFFHTARLRLTLAMSVLPPSESLWVYTQLDTTTVPYAYCKILSASGALAQLYLKSGGDQWRRQDLVSGWHDDRGAEGASIEVPNGERCPLPSRLRGLGEHRELPQWGPGWAPATIAFSAYGHRTLLVARKIGKIANSTLKKWWWQSPPLSKVVVTSHHRYIQSCTYDKGRRSV